jgi:hypothetical protein
MEEKSASHQIDDIIKAYSGWKGTLLDDLRVVILQGDQGIVEEIKWKMKTRPEGLPVWSHNGILCFAETWKDNIKLLFPKGSQLQDPSNLFNARLQSKDIRAIEFKQGDPINTTGLHNLVLEAIKLNT